MMSDEEEEEEEAVDEQDAWVTDDEDDHEEDNAIEHKTVHSASRSGAEVASAIMKKEGTNKEDEETQGCAGEQKGGAAAGRVTAKAAKRTSERSLADWLRAQRAC